MNRTLAATIAIAAALLLAGCSSAAPGETQSASTSTESAPLTAETPTTPSVSEADAAFLAAVREAQSEFETQIPNATDEQLLAAGAEACERRAAGEPSDTMSVIDGETPNVGGYYNDSGAIITAARTHLCPG